MSDEEEYTLSGEEGEEGEEVDEEEEEELDATDGDPSGEEKESDASNRPLTEESMKAALSLLARVGSGLAHAYVRLHINGRQLTDISILKKCIHLRYVNLAHNNIRDLRPLNSMSHLLVLVADHNHVTSVDLDEMPYLQMASFNNNRLKDLEGLSHPLLEKLSLANNDIDNMIGLDLGRLRNLHTLDLRGNQITTAAGPFPPSLKQLYLPSNLITSLEGLSGLPELTVLHLRDNQLKSLNGLNPGLKSLKYLNLRGNAITNVSQVKHLQRLPSLQAVILMENPFADEEEEDDYRLDVLVALELKKNRLRLDKDQFSQSEIQEAEELYEQRLEEQNGENGSKEGASDEEDRDSHPVPYEPPSGTRSLPSPKKSQLGPGPTTREVHWTTDES